MANLLTYTFDQIVTNIATAVQGSASALLDYTVGSVLRAIAEASAAVTLWLQAIILQVLTLTRAATSVGSDLDTWVADYGITRLPAITATGTVRFSRFSNTTQAVIPIGAQVQTSDGNQTFTVTIDTTNTAYNAVLDGYIMLANGSELLDVPAQANTPGSGGNIQGATLSVITVPIPGVDQVTNLTPFNNGVDAETDAELRTRFIAYLASLSKATKTAVGYAITSTQGGLNYTLTENQDYNGTTDMGYFYVVADDGSGDPPTQLLTNIGSAIDLVRPLCSRFGVFSPSVEHANVTMVLTTASGYNHSTVIGEVSTALQAFINALPLGASLPYTQLASIAYGVAGVTNVTGVLLNSGTSDLAATNQQCIKAGTLTIS